MYSTRWGRLDSLLPSSRTRSPVVGTGPSLLCRSGPLGYDPDPSSPVNRHSLRGTKSLVS